MGSGINATQAECPVDMKWKVILLCTEQESYMQVYNPYPNNCECVDITKWDDFTSEYGYHKTANTIQKHENVAILAALPCTGGCLLNTKVNAKNQKCKKKLEEHWQLFHGLWKNFARLCKQFPNVPMVFEWPRSCEYWKEEKVKRVMRQMKMERLEFDGCQYELKSVRNPHMFLRKPWQFATNIPEVVPFFDNFKCSGASEEHQHDETRGANALHSQYYTPFLVHLLHIAIFHNRCNNFILTTA